MSTIRMTFVGGTFDGQVLDRELELEEDGLTPIGHTFVTHEILPKIALRPAQVERPRQELKTQGPTFFPYKFSAWTVVGKAANYVPA